MKFFLFFCGLIISVCSLSGCVGSYYAHNTPSETVLHQATSTSEMNRVVTFDVVGKGVEPELSLSKGQAVLMAERAAVADGYRQFVEKIKGVYVDAYMKAGYGAVNLDALATNTRSWLRGVEIIEIRQGPFGIVEAHMQLRVNFIQNDMIWWPFRADNIPKS